MMAAAFTGWLGLQASAAAQKQPPTPAPAPDAGAGFLNVCNATGLSGSLTILMNGSTPLPDGYSLGGSTGQVGFAPGKVSVKLSHPKVENSKDVPVLVNRDENVTLIVYTTETKDPKTGISKYRLESCLAPHKPSPGRLSVTMVNCDPDKVIPVVNVGDQEMKLTSTVPTDVPMEQPKESYEIKVNGNFIMESLIPSQQDHYYVITFLNREQNRPQGLLAYDFKVNSLQDEDARLRAEVEIRTARETAANAKHEAEYQERILASRKEREQRRRERIAAMERPR